MFCHDKCGISNKGYFRIKETPLPPAHQNEPSAGQSWVFLRARTFLSARAAFKSSGNVGTGRGSGQGESWSRVSRDTAQSWTSSPQWVLLHLIIAIPQKRCHLKFDFYEFSDCVLKCKSCTEIQAITLISEVHSSPPESSTPEVTLSHTIFLLWFLTHRRPWEHSIRQLILFLNDPSALQLFLYSSLFPHASKRLIFEPGERKRCTALFLLFCSVFC